MHRKIILSTLIIASLLMLASTIVSAANKDSMTLQSTTKKNPAKAPEKEVDKPRGQLLYETHYTACHETSVHNRSTRKADSMEKVNYWVKRWNKELKLGWSKSDIGEVTRYVNSKYYNFAK